MYNYLSNIILNKTALVFFILFNLLEGYSQNVAFNADGVSPDASAALDISNSSKGILIPRVALTGISDNTTIASATTGLLIYNTSATGIVWPGYYYWNGAIWVRASSGHGGGFSWNILGNSATNASVNFVGTTDNIDFTFRTNNIERFRISGHLLKGMNNGNSLFIGEGAGAVDDLTNNYNVGIGYRALYTATNAEYSVGVGRSTLLNYNVSAGSSIAIGSTALDAASYTGTFNIAIGYSGLGSLTTGSYNLALGASGLTFLTTGDENVAILSSVFGTARYRNISIGGNVMNNVGTGSDNVAIGHQAMNSNPSSDRSVAIGFNSLRRNTNLDDNVAIGYQAAEAADNTSNSVYIGSAVAQSNTVSANNVHIGYYAGQASGTLTNTIVIDNQNTAPYLIYGDLTNNRVGIQITTTALAFEVGGEASKATSGNWALNSDKRIKKNIQDIENALETIKNLHPVKFKYTDEWKERVPYIKQNDHYYYNFIAQEYKKIFPKSVYGSGEYLKESKKEILQIDTYSSQIVLIKAIQEQQKMIEAQQSEIDTQQQIIDKNLQTLYSQNNQLLEFTKEIEKLKTNALLISSK